MAIKQIVSKSNLGSWIDIGAIEANKINPKLPVVNSTALLTTPTATGNTANLNEFVIGADGNQYYIDITGKATKFVSGFTTTSLTPQVYQGSGFTDAKADLNANVADALRLSNGEYISQGLLKYPSHGYTVGNYYYLSQATSGAFTDTIYTSGLSQRCFFVVDANTLLVDIQPVFDTQATAVFAKTVYLDTISPLTATIFDLNNPATTNDNSLKEDIGNLYVGSNGSTWTYNATSSTYSTYVAPASTEWYVAGTTTDAGSNKTNVISRTGGVRLGSTATTTEQLEITASLPDKSGVKLTNLTSASPSSTGKAIGVNATGEIVTVEGGSVNLTYGRVNALLDLASTTHINTDPGTKIPFTGTIYTSGMTVNAGSLIPTVSGRYRADWLCMATSTDFLADGIFFVVQNGVSVGQVSYNMNEASAVNQSAGMVDVTLVAGQEVSLHYRTRHTASDGIAWDRGSYFQLTQVAGHLPSTGQTVDYVFARKTATQPITVNTDIVWTTKNGNIPNANGVFTLTAGKTYELDSQVTLATGQAGNYATYKWVNATTNAELITGSGAGIALPTDVVGGNPANNQNAYLIYTPTVNETVKLRITASNGAQSLDFTSSFVSIKQLGSTSNTVGTLPALDQSSAGYFDIGNMRMQWGRNTVASTGNSITLPALFADSNYVVQMSSNVNIITFNSARTTTTFNVNMYTDAGGLSFNNIIQWFAIGQKP